MSITVTWHGHGTYTLDINGTKVVVDPFFAPNNPSATLTAGDVAADFILQTHGHVDHIADTVALATRTGAQVIANFEIHTWINNQGHENTHPMNTGGGWNFPFGRVKMTPALHSSGLPDGSYGGDPGGFLVTADNKHIYLAGDTAVFSDMALIGRAGLDFAILPVGDNFTMGPEDSLLALEYLKPKAVIPVHYNTWPYVEIDVDAWAASVREQTAVQPIVLEVEGSHTF
jgi:L-ascorbate metabolism protein UlaG (beta-lactamase superfamily)